MSSGVCLEAESVIESERYKEMIVIEVKNSRTTHYVGRTAPN